MVFVLFSVVITAFKCLNYYISNIFFVIYFAFAINSSIALLSFPVAISNDNVDGSV